MQNSSFHSLKHYLFYGNYFYGVCAVALSIEASTQQLFPLNQWAYYLAVGIATTIYYTKAYIQTHPLDISTNERTQWYIHHHPYVVITQWVLSISLVILCFILGRNVFIPLVKLPLNHWMIVLIFPIVAICYYGFGYQFNLRNNGWTKPFVIGFVWAGVVTVYPIIFHYLQIHSSYIITFKGCILFLKNWMFIAVLCIMFDIKDYAVDANKSLQTFVVQKGLRGTIYRIIIPLTIVGLITFIIYATNNHFPLGRIMLNTIPFIMLMMVAITLRTRKSILYYLMVVDGLMLLKAICGTIAILLIKG